LALVTLKGWEAGWHGLLLSVLMAILNFKNIASFARCSALSKAPHVGLLAKCAQGWRAVLVSNMYGC
jgi:hypothetical protein